jgi:predicted DNA-binding transcriptional regulator YafY
MSPRAASTIKTHGLVGPDRQKEALGHLREAGAQGITRERLRAKMGGVSLRTVDRAIQLMEAQGARLERVRKGSPAVLHFTLKKGPSWDEHVSSEARLALRVAGLSLAQSGTNLWQDKLEALENLASERMSSRDRRLFDNLKKAIHVQGGVEDPIETEDILEPILKALDGQKEMEVEYQAAGAKGASTRKVVPFALTHDLFSGGTFLLVWEPARQLPLHLRLSRIGAIKVTARTGSLPQELMAQAARYQIGGWTSAEPPFLVEARIKGAHWIQAFKEAPPALPAFTADAAPDGASVRITFKATHALGATRWLLQFGAAAEVLAPEKLRQDIHAQFKAAAAQYE